MKTQEEYAREIDEIVRRDVESCQSDWFKIDKEIFMQPKNKNKIFILGTRKTGCDLIILGGTNCDEGSMDWLFGSLGNENFYVCQPLSFYKSQREIQKVNPLYAFKVATAYFRAEKKIILCVFDYGLPINNVIYYPHTNTLFFNWNDYGGKITQEEFDDFVNNVDRSQLPEGIKFELK